MCPAGSPAAAPSCAGARRRRATPGGPPLRYIELLISYLSLHIHYQSQSHVRKTTTRLCVSNKAVAELPTAIHADAPVRFSSFSISGFQFLILRIRLPYAHSHILVRRHPEGQDHSGTRARTRTSRFLYRHQVMSILVLYPRYAKNPSSF